MNRTLGLLATIVLSSAIAHADDLRLGEPAYGGTGCPVGTVGVAVAPDQQSITMIFDQFVAEAGDSKRIDRKSCNVAVPIHVPNGFSVSIFAIDYRGFVSLPRGAKATLAVNYFLANDKNGVRTSKTFQGPDDSEYLKSDSIGLASTVWTPCGANTILRMNSSMLVQSNARREQSLATVDSADISAGVVYRLAYRRCK